MLFIKVEADSLTEDQKVSLARNLTKTDMEEIRWQRML